MTDWVEMVKEAKKLAGKASRTVDVQAIVEEVNNRGKTRIDELNDKELKIFMDRLKDEIAKKEAEEKGNKGLDSFK